MILRYPTGLYQDAGQLPVKESDSGNITYTISNETPNRSTAPTVQLTSSEELKQLPVSDYTVEYRRESFGELIYTVVDSNESIVSSNKKLFSVGQILEFDDEEIPAPTSTNVQNIDIQHNTNIIDYSDVGLSDDETDKLLSDASIRKSQLETEIASLQSSIKDTNLSIVDNQKKINETKKVILAVESISSVDPILVKLRERYTELITTRDTLIDTQNDLSVQLGQSFDLLLKVVEVVK